MSDLSSRAAILQAAAAPHLKNPVLHTFGVAQLLTELLALVADMAAAVGEQAELIEAITAEMVAANEARDQ